MWKMVNFSQRLALLGENVILLFVVQKQANFTERTGVLRAFTFTNATVQLLAAHHAETTNEKCTLLISALYALVSELSNRESDGRIQSNQQVTACVTEVTSRYLLTALQRQKTPLIQQCKRTINNQRN